MYNIVHNPGKIDWVPCFIKNRFPHQYTRVIPVAADHVSYIFVNSFGKDRFIVPELPAWRGHNIKEPECIACIHKCRIDRVMSCAYNITACLFQYACIEPLPPQVGGERITHIGMILVTVCPYQLALIGFVVKVESIFSPEINYPDPPTFVATPSKDCFFLFRTSTSSL